MSKQTSQEWADYIMAAINAAMDDGASVVLYYNGYHSSCCDGGDDISLDVCQQGDKTVELRF